MQTENLEGQESIFGQDSACGKMSSVLSQVGGTLKRVKKSLGRIFKKSSKRSSKLKNHTFMLLDLRPGAGNMLGAYWEYDPPWLGSFGMLNTSECPKDAVECSLWQILQATAPSRYSLSQTACLGTLTATDRHSVYARQRADQFRDDEIASTESARQHKDATDLICQPPSTWDTDCRNLIRRLTPLECERLQGYPDGWTDVPGASDSARYKALGNSVAIPCVEYLMQRVAMVITLDLEWDF